MQVNGPVGFKRGRLEMPKESQWTRRGVLRLAWTGIVATGILSLAPLVQYLRSDEDQPQSPLVSFDKELEIGADWQQVSNTRTWVKRDELGIMAVLATCTHLGCEVKYQSEKGQWLCPCHGSIYDVEGRPTSGPAPRALSRVAVEIKPDGSLIVNTAKQVEMDTRAK